MNKFTAGLIAGSLIGAAGLSYAMQDRRFRKRMMKDGKRFVHKCANALETATDWK